MKILRLLTTIITLQLAISGSQINAQDIAEFQLRTPAPSTPFLWTGEFDPAVQIQPLDDNGQVIPANQCRPSEKMAQMDRCEFSAGQLVDFTPAPTSRQNPDQKATAVSAGTKPQDNAYLDATEPAPVAQLSATSGKCTRHQTARRNEVDLSPLNFDCMHSACEFEYTSSARQLQKNLQKVEQKKQTLNRQQARQIIHSAFRKFAPEKIHTPEFDPFEFVPYTKPDRAAGIEPVTTNRPKLAPLAVYRQLFLFWKAQILGSRWIQRPAEAVYDELIQLECRLCGTPILNLAYGIRERIDAEFQEIRDHQKMVAVAKRNAAILNGVAKLLRKSGNGLNQMSSFIAEISKKQVESVQAKMPAIPASSDTH